MGAHPRTPQTPQTQRAEGTQGTHGRPVWWLAAVNLVSLGSLAAPAMASIPLRIDAVVEVEHRSSSLALALTLGGIAALISNPVFGVLSDRTRGRLGRRRPWMLGGTLAGFLCVIALNFAHSLPAIILSWVCMQVAYNATMAASAALLADSVPAARRAAASGVFTAAAFVGVIPPLALTALFPRHVNEVSLVMPLAGLVVVALAMRLSDSRATHPTTARRARFRPPRGFVAVWLQRLAMQSGLSLATAFTLYMVIDRMTDDPVAATPLAMIATICGGTGIALGAAIGGAWASRVQRSLPFLVCGALGLAVAAIIRSMTEGPVMLWVAAGVGGIALGAYLAVNMALAMRLMPAESAGTYLGVLNVADTIPQVWGPLVAAGLLTLGAGDPISGAHDNYFALYLAAAAVAALSLASLPTIRAALRSTAAGASPAALHESLVHSPGD